MYSTGIIFALLAASLFGISNILVRKVFVNIEPRVGIFVTILFSAVAVLLLSLVDGEIWSITRMTETAVLLYALVGFLNFTVGRTLNYYSISLSGPSVTSALISLRIFFAVSFSLLFLNEALTAERVLGDVLMFVGITVVTLSNGIEGGKLSRGVVLGLAASAVGGMCDVLVSLASTFNGAPSNGLMISYIIGLTTYLPIVMGKNIPKGSFKVISNRSILWILLLVGVTSGLAQASRYFSLGNAPVSVAVPLISLTPIVTMLLSAVFLKSEKLGIPFVAGVIMAFAGTIFLSV